MIKSISSTLRGLSIHQKFMLVIMVTSMLALILTFCGFGWYNIMRLREGTIQQMRLLAQAIGDRSNACLLYLDPKVCNENLAAFRVKPSITIACIYDVDGQIFTHYISRSNPGRSCPSLPVPGERSEKGILSFTQNIMLGEDKVGSLYVESDLTEIEEDTIQYIKYVMIFILAGSVFAYAISSRLLRLVMAPIFNLVSAAQAVSIHHNYSVRAEKMYKDELGVLVDAFNEMLFEIQKRDRQLMAAKENLELKVVDRTRDLEKAKEAAETANRAKSDFLANMSHELRTPMHAILSYAGFGIDEVEKAEIKTLQQYFSRIRESGKRLLSLLNNLLDLSKLEFGKMDFDFQQHDLKAALDTVLREVQKLLEQKKLILEVIEPTCGTKAVFDYQKIVQVIANLLSNAIKFSPEGGRVIIRFGDDAPPLDEARSNEWLSMFVSDEGPGIPESELEKVFDKFVQSSKTKSGAGGTGLGLAISSEIVHEHQGRIWCRNNRDKGSTFIFCIPRTLQKRDSSIIRGEHDKG